MASTCHCGSTVARNVRLFTISILLMGCSGSIGQDWHTKVGWKAEDYFTDPQVIALCAAIEANDLDEIDRLVKAGTDINAKGNDNMTPLLWAFPDNKLERFKKLLELGADPNVVVESKFNTRGGIYPGGSVTHLAATTAFPGYFEAVMKHGGDPHFRTRQDDETLVQAIIKSPASDKKARIQLLIDRKVDLDHVSALYTTATMTAVSWGGQYDIALMLLESGADPGIYCTNSNQKLVHIVLMEEDKRLNHIADARVKDDYDKLVRFLVDQGESVEDARKDLERWKSWGLSKTPAQIKELREREVADRIARETAGKECRERDAPDKIPLEKNKTDTP